MVDSECHQGASVNEVVRRIWYWSGFWQEIVSSTMKSRSLRRSILDLEDGSYLKKKGETSSVYSMVRRSFDLTRRNDIPYASVMLLGLIKSAPLATKDLLFSFLEEDLAKWPFIRAVMRAHTRSVYSMYLEKAIQEGKCVSEYQSIVSRLSGESKNPTDQ